MAKDNDPPEVEDGTPDPEVVENRRELLRLSKEVIAEKEEQITQLEAQIDRIVDAKAKTADGAERMLSLGINFLTGMAINAVTAASIVNFAFQGAHSMEYFYLGCCCGAVFLGCAGVFSYISANLLDEK